MKQMDILERRKTQLTYSSHTQQHQPNKKPLNLIKSLLVQVGKVVQFSKVLSKT